MAQSDSVDTILEFLRKNKFARAESALLGELNNRPDLNGYLEKLTIGENKTGEILEEENVGRRGTRNLSKSDISSGEVSKELIVKEIECGSGRNGSENTGKSATSAETLGKNFAFSRSLEDTVLDLYSWDSNASNGIVDRYQNDIGINTNNFHVNSHSKSSEETSASGQMKTSWPDSYSKSSGEGKHEKNQYSELKELDKQHKVGGKLSNENFVENPWSRPNEPLDISSELWKNCSIKTVFPFSEVDSSTSNVGIGSQKEGKRIGETSDVRAAIKEQVDEVGRVLYFGKIQEISEQKNGNNLNLTLVPENQREEFPRLPPVRLKSLDKALNINWDEKFDSDGVGSKITSADNAFHIGTYLDVPIGQEINTAEQTSKNLASEGIQNTTKENIASNSFNGLDK